MNECRAWLEQPSACDLAIRVSRGEQHRDTRDQRRHNPGRPPITTERSFALTALSAFFGAGVLASSASALALAFPGSWLESVWRLNPEARVGFGRMGPWAGVLMTVVALACNLLGDLLNTVVRGDWRTLIGLPIGGAMLAYLLSRRIRDRFRFA